MSDLTEVGLFLDNETSLLRQSVLNGYDLPEDSDLEDGETEEEPEADESLEPVINPEHVESPEVDSASSTSAAQPSSDFAVEDKVKVSTSVRVG